MARERSGLTEDEERADESFSAHDVQELSASARLHVLGDGEAILSRAPCALIRGMSKQPGTLLITHTCIRFEPENAVATTDAEAGGEGEAGIRSARAASNQRAGSGDCLGVVV